MKIDLQKLLDALSEGTDLDTILTDEVSGAELATIESEAIEAGKAIAGAADKTPADADRLDAIVKVAQKVRTVVSTRATAAAELETKLAEKMALLEPAKAETEEASEEAPVEETPAAPEVEGDGEVVVAEPELAVAASAKPIRVDVAAIRARVPAPKPVAAGVTSHLVAAADVPGVPAGASIDMMGLAASLGRKLKSLGPDSGRPMKGIAPSYSQVASLVRPDTEFMAEDTAADILAIERASDERRLKGGSLTAAGTWCAPSEILYDLCDDGASLDGLISLPGIRARRGGIQWTTGADFCEVFDSASTGFWTMTEAQVDAAVEKPCFEIPCTEFDECRLEPLGFCLQGGLLMQAGYPELIADWVRKTSVAFAHYRNAYIINKVLAGSDNIGVVAGCGAGVGGGATGSVLSAIENQVQSFRERHRLPFNASLELKAPFWIKSVIRADLSQRTGVDLISVTDAMIDGWFTQRGVNVQYLYDWQPLNTTCDAGATATDWPGFVEFILYRAGTWVEVTQPIINIDARYDASLTKTNRYGIRFTEEGLCIVKKCNDSKRFQVDLCPTGATTAPEAACACASV
jgi:hypothetical protein